MMRRLILLCLLSALPAVTLGRVFKSVGPDGQVTFGDNPPRAERVDDLPDVIPVAPGLEGEPLHAALTVYYTETMVEFSYRFCRDKVPQQQKNVLEARNQWNNTHSGLRQKKIVVLHDHYGADQLRKMAAEAEKQQMALLAKVGAAPAEDQLRWCTEAPVRFEGPSMSPIRKPAVVRAIETYRPLMR